MNNRSRRVASVVVLLGSCVGAAFASDPPQPASPEQIVGTTYRVEPAYYVECHVPNVEVDKVLQAVAEAVKLEYGKYDQVAFIDAPGMEQFRPLDPVVLKKALDAIHKVHSYEEPVVYIHEVWRTRNTGGDDSNPEKWWNRKDR